MAVVSVSIVLPWHGLLTVRNDLTQCDSDHIDGDQPPPDPGRRKLSDIQRDDAASQTDSQTDNKTSSNHRSHTAAGLVYQLCRRSGRTAWQTAPAMKITLARPMTIFLPV
jgi:hypothetical protein